MEIICIPIVLNMSTREIKKLNIKNVAVIAAGGYWLNKLKVLGNKLLVEERS